MTKIEPPLVEGEWVVAEHAMDHKGYKLTYRVEGLISSGGSTYAEIGGSWAITPDWTILERRPPKPDWADADAILATSISYTTRAYAKAGDGTRFGDSTVDEWVDYLRTGDVLSIKGLYLRGNS